MFEVFGCSWSFPVLSVLAVELAGHVLALLGASGGWRRWDGLSAALLDRLWFLGWQERCRHGEVVGLGAGAFGGVFGTDDGEGTASAVVGGFVVLADVACGVGH